MTGNTKKPLSGGFLKDYQLAGSNHELANANEKQGEER